MPAKESILVSDPEWYRDAVIYQVHIKSFCDGNGDGIGDFKGLISKLDYLENLGVNAIWILPFYPSPLRDDGYDIADYRNVNPDYGTLGDFRRLLKESHKRGMRVITELVMNHTSDQHAWFQRARTSGPKSQSRNYYVWTEKPDKYLDARIIFQDFETSNWSYDPLADAYYWHRFYSHQPDLNFDNPKVHEEMFKIMDFWFGMGVDGMRLDAVPYLYEREGTNCENLPETYDFLKKLRTHVEQNHEDKMLLAEANQWPEDAVAYFGDGDACHMCFHFPLMPRMFMAAEMEDRYPIIDILEQTPELPEGCQWAMFLRNHDELTLEMVTDEERDYMYRIYAKDPRARINLGIRRRLAPLLDNDRLKIELMNILLFTMPGSPVVYYGDEIGMGDNYYLGDRDGVRTPMQWSATKNSGFSDANPQRLYLPVIIDPEYHFETINVENQNHRQSSLLWWMRRLISLRKSRKVFGRGSIEFLTPENHKVLAFIREYEGESVLVVANLSRHSQVVQLDLSKYAGVEPKDMFSWGKFLRIDQYPYALTLGPHGYYIFDLGSEEEREEAFLELPQLKARSWKALFDNKQTKKKLEDKILPAYIQKQRWFGGKAQTLRKMEIMERIPIGRAADDPLIVLVSVEYTDAPAEIYIIPLTFKYGKRDEDLPQGALARALIEGMEVIVYEAVYSQIFCKHLLDLIAGRKRMSAQHGSLKATKGRELKKRLKDGGDKFECRILGAEQSNTSIIYGKDLIMKFYRRTEKGVHPDLEMARFLTEKAKYPNTPPFAGSLEYTTKSGENMILALMQGFVSNQGDAWEQNLDLVHRYYERVLSRNSMSKKPPKAPYSIMDAVYADELPEPLDRLLSGVTLEMANLLGKRTAEMHAALASDKVTKGMRPENFSTLYQRSLFQSMQVQAKQELRLLKKHLNKLPEHVRTEAEDVLSMENKIIAKLRGITGKKLNAQKVRIHGDFHLGQVLYTGKDYIIFDFEGEPARPLTERRLKRSPVRDVAGMIRSYQYAAYSALFKDSSLREEDREQLEPWAELWYLYIGGAYIRGYLDALGDSPIVPDDRDQFERMLAVYLIQKAVYEMGYELNNRPEWLIIPLRGIKYLSSE